MRNANPGATTRLGMPLSRVAALRPATNKLPTYPARVFGPRFPLPRGALSKPKLCRHAIALRLLLRDGTKPNMILSSALRPTRARIDAPRAPQAQV
jgi:hypothetical protein